MDTDMIPSLSLFFGTSLVMLSARILRQSGRSSMVARTTVSQHPPPIRKQHLRIVSLCPSTTQTLYDLGLAKYVVGRTRYCPDAPPPHASVPRMGGTKNPKWKMVQEAQPTHILFNMEENDYTHLPQAQEICAQTLEDTPVDIEGSRQMILHFGNIFGVEAKAQAIVDNLDAALDELSQIRQASTSRFSYLYFIWHTPHQRVVGQGTYIHAMLEAAGGTNLAVSSISDTERYPLFPHTFPSDHPADICLLSTEPYHFQEKHIVQYQQYGKDTKIIDGELLSWHGSRTVEGLRYLIDFFHGSK